MVVNKNIFMNHSYSHFKNISGSNNYYQFWLPNENPDQILLVVHGFAEHGGRYKNLIDHFLPLNYAIYALDHVGHGNSDGYRYYVDSIFDFVDSIKKLTEIVKVSHPNKQVFILGHSMGGLLTSLALIDHQEEYEGAILSAPLIKNYGYISPVLIFITRILSVVLPKFGVNSIDAEYISRDPKVVKDYLNDPLISIKSKITAKLAIELINGMKFVLDNAYKITLPIKIFQGMGDVIVDPGGAQLLYDAISSDDKKIKHYDILFHEILNEPEKKDVLKDIEYWLEAHVS